MTIEIRGKKQELTDPSKLFDKGKGKLISRRNQTRFALGVEGENPGSPIRCPCITENPKRPKNSVPTLARGGGKIEILALVPPSGQKPYPPPAAPVHLPPNVKEREEGFSKRNPKESALAILI